MLAKMAQSVLCLPATVQSRRHAIVGRNVEFGWWARCVNGGARERIVIGDNCSIWGRFICHRDGKIRVGSFTTIRHKTLVGSAASVSIGDYCMISNNVIIMDNNNHPVSPEKRRELLKSGFYGPLWDWEHSEKSPIVIQDNVWIGVRAIILKGVTIGEGAIVAAGSVVFNDVPSYCVAAGNPARVVKRLEH